MMALIEQHTMLSAAENDAICALRFSFINDVDIYLAGLLAHCPKSKLVEQDVIGYFAVYWARDNGVNIHAFF